MRMLKYFVLVVKMMDIALNVLEKDIYKGNLLNMFQINSIE